MATLESVKQIYCEKHSINQDALSELDLKIINGILRVKLSYAEQLEKRRCTVILDKPHQSYETKKENNLHETPKETKKTQVHSSTAVLICKAVTMKGTPCKAKAKPGCEFCGKHLPK
jgi:hypothetical protein